MTRSHLRGRGTPASVALSFLLIGAPWAFPAPAQASTRDEAARATPPPGAEEGQTQGVVWTGEPGVTETVAEIMARDARLPKGALLIRKKPEHATGIEKNPNPEAPEASQWPPAQGYEGSFVRLPYSPQTVGTSFLGPQLSESGFIPPDSIGAVSTTQVVVAANGRIKVFSKAGVLGGLDTDTDNFFDSVGGQANGTSDPHVRFDRLSQRWFVTIVDLATVNHVLIAVSNSATITNTSSFTFFSFQHDLVGPTPNADTDGFADYDTLGVDKNALYIGANIFRPTFIGTTGYVVNKASLLDGGGFTVTAFRQLAGNTCPSTGVYTPQGVNNDDPNATEGYFIGVDVCVFGKLVMKRVGTPGGTPTISGNLVVAGSIPSTDFPIEQVQPSAPTLDALDDRLFAASVHTNKITGVKTLWTAHNIEVNSSGVASGSGNRNGSRWYQIGSLTTTPALVQAGTLFSSAASNPFGFWIPSIAMSGQGHAAIGTSRASAVGGTGSADGHASIAVAGRLRTDAAGSTQASTLAVDSDTSYDVEGGAGGQRWGDYSQTVVDPSDDQTLWTFQEYCNGTDSWGVRALQLKAPLPATPTSATSVAGGLASVNVSVTGASSSGTEFFDPGPDTNGPGFPSHIAGSVSGGVTVNSASFVDTTHVTLSVSTVGVTPGTKNVTITNPDGQQATGSNILTVTCQAITVNQTSIPAGVAGTAYTATTFTQTGGLGGATFSKTGTLPTGMSFGTPNCSAATLCGTPTQTGTFPITITITDGNGCQGSHDYNLVIGCQTIALNPSTIATGQEGVAGYSQTFTQTGALGTPSFSLFNVLTQNSTPPAGLGFVGATGVLSGTPNAAGSFPIVITTNDAPNNCKRDHAYTLVVTSAAGTAPTALAVDAAGNGVLDPTDSTVSFDPTWFNNSGGSITPTGAISSPSAGLSLGADASASYGTIADGALASCSAGDCYTTMSAPGPRPTQHWDTTLTETLSSPTDAKNWTVHVGGSFSDVTTANPFYRFVETIFHKGVTSGCGASTYCPASPTQRDQMAVFLLRGKLGNSYTPPACAGIFQDVPCPGTFTNFIEDLANRKITSGCSLQPSLYCPGSAVTRAQMALFLLKALEGAAYVPPACGTAPFGDVPTTHPFCVWIKELAARSITSGCGNGNYCPDATVTREQMATFLTRTFSLLLNAP